MKHPRGKIILHFRAGLLWYKVGIDFFAPLSAFLVIYYNLLVCHKASPFAEEGVSFKLITAVTEYKVLNQSGVVRPFPIYSTSGQSHAQGVRRGCRLYRSLTR